MENHPHESIDTVFGCVIPYIHDGDDRKSVSLVCRKWYELDCTTRKHVTVHLPYCNSHSLFLLHQRFPSIESLTLQGFPDTPRKYITRWIQEISDSYKCLKALHVRHVFVLDSDLELLARRHGKDLRHLKITTCWWFSTDGLMHIGKYCTNLKSLSLKGCQLDYRDGKWLHELALHNSSIESLDFSSIRCENIDVNDLTLLAKNCSQSLVSFKFRNGEIDLKDFFSYAVRLEDCDVYKYVGFKFPPNLRCMGMFELSKSSFPFVLPFVHQLRELKIVCATLDVDSLCLLIQRCPKLEVFKVPDVPSDGNRDKVLQGIGQFCKKLRKLKTWFGSCMGLIAVAQGCVDLECLHIEDTVVKKLDITSENLECIGTHLKNLRDFSMVLSTSSKTTIPSLDNGVRHILIGCSKLERLRLCLPPGALTDVGLGYIARYGHVLKYLSLAYLGECDLGLVELSKGCPKLRELEITCPFHRVYYKLSIMVNIHSLRYVWGRDGGGYFRMDRRLMEMENKRYIKEKML